MFSSLLNNWLFLAGVSAVATALLIVLSWEAFGGMHSSLIMVVRVLGVIAIVAPVAIFAVRQGKTGLGLHNIGLKAILLWISIGISAGISWYSFYLALEVGKKTHASIALITTINYSSVIIILLISWMLGYQKPEWRNLLGVVLVAAGIYFVSVRTNADPRPEPPITSGHQPPG